MMDDLISRQAAKEILDKNQLPYHIYPYVWDAIDALPSAQPEPKRGKWIHISEEMWKCDQCGEISCCSPNFCPDCGADMRGK